MPCLNLGRWGARGGAKGGCFSGLGWPITYPALLLGGEKMGPGLREPGSFMARENLQKENKHHPFPLSHGAEGRQERERSANERGVENGVEVDPGDVPQVVLLGGQNLGDKMVPIEEPLSAKNVENLKN